MIEYFEVESGNVLDRFSQSQDGQITYETGVAQAKVESMARRFGSAAALTALTDWSNGYVAAREMK